MLGLDLHFGALLLVLHLGLDLGSFGLGLFLSFQESLSILFCPLGVLNPSPNSNPLVPLDSFQSPDSFGTRVLTVQVFPHLWREGCYALPLATLAVRGGKLGGQCCSFFWGDAPLSFLLEPSLEGSYGVWGESKAGASQVFLMATGFLLATCCSDPGIIPRREASACPARAIAVGFVRGRRYAFPLAAYPSHPFSAAKTARKNVNLAGGACHQERQEAGGAVGLCPGLALSRVVFVCFSTRTFL